MYSISRENTYNAVARLTAQLHSIRNDSIAGRPSCLHCVEKHIASALVAAGEVNAGYPEHRLLVIGHLHEAAEESRDEYPELSDFLRQVRLEYSATGELPTVYELYDLLQEYAGA